MKAGAKFQSRDLAWAHAKSQHAITAEIIKAAVDLPSQPGVTISAEAYALLRKILDKIDDIKRIYQPAVSVAHQTFDNDLKKINVRVTAIQTALMSASSSVVRGDKAGAIRQVDYALWELGQLPAPAPQPAQPAAAPTTVPANGPQSGTTEDEQLTRDKFVEMLTPIKALINGTFKVPQI